MDFLVKQSQNASLQISYFQIAWQTGWKEIMCRTEPEFSRKSVTQKGKQTVSHGVELIASSTTDIKRNERPQKIPTNVLRKRAEKGEKMKEHLKLVSAIVTESKPVPIMDAIKKTENRDPPSKTKVYVAFRSRTHKQNSRTMRKEKTTYYGEG